MPQYRLNLNGADRTFEAPAGLSLLDLIRDYAGLTGAKYACGEGQCGACTVLVNGRAAKACITLASSAINGKVTTIEGLATGGRLHPVQQAFLEKAALQCGFCTPGMIMGAVALLETKPTPAEADVVGGLNGHVCRCGAYPRIVEAVKLAAQMKEERRRG